MVTLVSIYERRIVVNLGIQRIEQFLKNRDILCKTLYLSTYEAMQEECDSVFQNSTIIGISTYADTLRETSILVERLKRKFPQKIIFTGSQYFTTCYETVFSMIPAFDFGILGAGEYPLMDFIQGYCNESVMDIIAKHPHLISPTCQINKEPCIVDIEELPWPSQSKKILEKDLFAYLNSSQGCIGNCSFCGHIRCKWSGRTPEAIIKEILHINQTYNINAFSFSDNSIEDPGSLGKKRLHQVAKSVLKLEKRFAFNGFIRADSFSDSKSDNEILSDLRKAGFNQFLVGIEAGNPADLVLYNKRASLEQNEGFLKLLELNDIHASIGFINVNPYSTAERLIQNYNFLERNNNYFPGCYFSYLIVYENTDIFHKIKQDNLLVQNGYRFSYEFLDPFAHEYYKFIREKYIKTPFSQMLLDLQNLVKTINYLVQILDAEEEKRRLAQIKSELCIKNSSYFAPFFDRLRFNLLYSRFDAYREAIEESKWNLDQLYIKLAHRYLRNRRKYN